MSTAFKCSTVVSVLKTWDVQLIIGRSLGMARDGVQPNICPNGKKYIDAVASVILHKCNYFDD